MRRQLIATTALIALAAILVLGIPLGTVESTRARNDAIEHLEREADTIAAAVDVTTKAHPDQLAAWLHHGHAALVADGGQTFRIGRMPAGELLSTRSGAAQGVHVTIFAPAAEAAAGRRNVWLLIAVLAIAGTAAAAGLAILQARRLIRPLERLVATSDRLGAGDFSARAGRIEQPELDRVAVALDGAAVQIAQLVGRQREFAANVSHQLRTPLTAMRLWLDELATLDDPVAARDVITSTQRVADRLERTVADLLALARAGDIGQPRDVDLADLAREHAAGWAPLYARVGRRLQTSAETPLPARVSPGGVAQALDVLLENAIAHGGGTTRLTASEADGRSVLAVEDDGPGVPKGMELEIFDRAVSTAGSTGLGLPLARALVEAEGGRLVLASPRPARFEILIPRPRAHGSEGEL
ncbi:HAMP domain-containing sensor histidine kinase [Candidatus Solirubrobacter pratensis]|uniref:HAMP domain-containing sensor histidine kinase n=1 Tax=Candidatus Solirubrobacter pratensis TaxID=1298857 RepID=UPI0004188013|nr:HAMP domain-containing sensor histidine kinase [Candidatus Solirubrobacter pratensis]